MALGVHPAKDCVRNKREYFLCEVQAVPALHTKNILFYLILDSKVGWELLNLGEKLWETVVAKVVAEDRVCLGIQ
jgi:hypothetical protein